MKKAWTWRRWFPYFVLNINNTKKCTTWTWLWHGHRWQNQRRFLTGFAPYLDNFIVCTPSVGSVWRYFLTPFQTSDFQLLDCGNFWEKQWSTHFEFWHRVNSYQLENHWKFTIRWSLVFSEFSTIDIKLLHSIKPIKLLMERRSKNIE